MTDWQQRAAKTYERIKHFYLGAGRTEEQWAEVAQNPAKFNRVWRKMLRLPAGDMPPGVEPKKTIAQ